MGLFDIFRKKSALEKEVDRHTNAETKLHKQLNATQDENAKTKILNNMAKEKARNEANNAKIRNNMYKK